MLDTCYYYMLVSGDVGFRRSCCCWWPVKTAGCTCSGLSRWRQAVNAHCYDGIGQSLYMLW